MSPLWIALVQDDHFIIYKFPRGCEPNYSSSSHNRLMHVSAAVEHREADEKRQCGEPSATLLVAEIDGRAGLVGAPIRRRLTLPAGSGWYRRVAVTRGRMLGCLCYVLEADDGGPRWSSAS